MVLVVHGQHLVEYLFIAVERESEVADAACLALLHQEVHHAIVHVAGVEFVHAATYCVQQVVVDVVDLQVLHRFPVHLDAGLAALRRRVEVGELRGHEIFLTLVATQRNARTGLRLALTVDGRRVEIVHAVLDGVVHLAVNHLLVVVVLVFGLRRQAHHAIAQQRHLVVTGGVVAVGHLAHGRLHLLLVFFDGLTLSLRLTAYQHSCSTQCSSAQ